MNKENWFQDIYKLEGTAGYTVRNRGLKHLILTYLSGFIKADDFNFAVIHRAEDPETIGQIALWHNEPRQASGEIPDRIFRWSDVDACFYPASYSKVPTKIEDIILANTKLIETLNKTQENMVAAMKNLMEMCSKLMPAPESIPEVVRTPTQELVYYATIGKAICLSGEDGEWNVEQTTNSSCRDLVVSILNESARFTIVQFPEVNDHICPSLEKL